MTIDVIFVRLKLDISVEVPTEIGYSSSAGSTVVNGIFPLFFDGLFERISRQILISTLECPHADCPD